VNKLTLITFTALLLAPLAVLHAAESADPFAPYLDGKAPEILREVSSTNSPPENITVRRLVFRSRDESEIFAVIAAPKTPGVHPGMLVLHGGGGSAEIDKAMAWAARGYVAVAPDLPGIADPKKLTETKGRWNSLKYGEGRWVATPDAGRSVIFDAVLAAMRSLYLLRSQPDVDTSRIGVVGCSWGGYMTTMVCGLAGDQVRAGFAVWGCGFYELTAQLNGPKSTLGRMPEDERERWLQHLDAGRRARGMKAAFFIAGATNDFFYWPRAVQATLDAIPGEKNHLYAPNSNHKAPVPGGSVFERKAVSPFTPTPFQPYPTPSGNKANWLAMEVPFFDYYLKDVGQPLPKVSVEKGGDPLLARFSIAAPRPLTKVEVYWAATNPDVMKRLWLALPATKPAENVYEAKLPAEAADWFALASDDRPATVSSDLIATTPQPAMVAPPQGVYFATKKYVPRPLPTLAETRGKLPSPIYDENPQYVEMYWKTWELAFRHFYEPQPGSGFVSQFIDAAFSKDVFLWDSCFMSMFCNYAHPLVPGIGSLDNFYAKQYADGEIGRQINRTTGRDKPDWVNWEHKDLFCRGDSWPGHREATQFSVTYAGREVPQPPHLTLDALNHPIFAWAELEYVRMTGNRSRWSLVYPPLVQYYRALQKYLCQGNGLYVTDWASMDNSPRNPFLKGGGTAVDISAEMVLFGNQLAEIADGLGKNSEARTLRHEAAEVARAINDKMWNPARKFYFDLTLDGRQAPVKTVAAYWTLLAGVASPEQADALAAELRNPQSFGRRHRVPTTPADQDGFEPAGHYWRGSVWWPINTMVIRGLERYGKHDLAREIALEDLRIVNEVFRNTGTLWENYAPDAAAPGKPAMRDFVGWTGIVPILYFLEYGVGLKADAPNNRLTWMLSSTKRCGCERFRFNSHKATLIAQPADDPSGPVHVNVDSDGQFRLWVARAGKCWDFLIQPGKNRFALN
jgi:dienelactone hydrolase